MRVTVPTAVSVGQTTGEGNYIRRCEVCTVVSFYQHVQEVDLISKWINGYRTVNYHGESQIGVIFTIHNDEEMLTSSVQCAIPALISQ